MSLEDAAQRWQEQEAEHYRLLSAAELAAHSGMHWRIKGVLPAQGIAALYGPSGSGKSFLALDACTAIAEGRDWFEYRTTPCPIVYVALEGEAGYVNRARAWEVANQRPVPDTLRFIIRQPFNLLSPFDVERLIQAVEAAELTGGIVVIDTTQRATPGADENSSGDMGMALEAVKRIAERTQGLVLLIGHTGKDSARGLRGWSGVIAALDSAIETSGNRGNPHKLFRIDKVKDGHDGAEHAFKLRVIELGSDEDGDTVTSCVVEPEERQTEQRERKLTGANRIAHEALLWCLEHEHSPTPDALKAELAAHPARVVAEDAWRKRCYTTGISDGDTESKRRAFGRARQALMDRGKVSAHEGYYYL